MTTKVCTNCKIAKDYSTFADNIKNGKKLAACKACYNVSSKISRIKYTSHNVNHDCNSAGCTILSRICNQCKNIKTFNEFPLCRSRKLGHASMCKKCNQEYKRLEHKQNGIINSNHSCALLECYNKYRTCPTCHVKFDLLHYSITKSKKDAHYTNCKLCEIKYHAKAMNRVFELGDEKAWQLIFSNCEYCHIEPNPVHAFDRMDNDKGYSLDNVVACCSNCNWMKGSLEYQKFRASIRQIILTALNHPEIWGITEQEIEEALELKQLSAKDALLSG